MPTSRFCSLVGIPERTWRRWQHKAREGRLPKGPWPQPVRAAHRDVIIELATRHPAWGHRKIWAMARHDGYRISQRTVARLLDAEGLLLKADYHSRPASPTSSTRSHPERRDEPDPRPGEHCAEHLQPVGEQTPVDHHRLARRPHRRPTLMTTDLTTHLPLHAGDKPTEVPVRPPIARSTRGRQQPLRAATPVRFAHQIEHDRADPVGVLRYWRTLRTFIVQLAGLVGEHLALDRLRVHPAHLAGGAKRPQTRVRVNNIHVLPR